jgi:hypothetical protein
MPSLAASRDEDLSQLVMLATPFDEPMSGRIRYAAAMYFYQRGMISAECLEVYRICSRLDHEDPRPFLARLGLAKEVEALASTIHREASARP